MSHLADTTEAGAPGRRPGASRLVRALVVLLKLLGALVVLALLAGLGVVMREARHLRDEFDAVDVTLPPRQGPVTWAIVGIDDRQYLDQPVDPKDPQATGARADIVLIATQTDHGVQLTSVPRNLTATVGQNIERLTITWMRSPQTFVDVMCDTVGVPLTHVALFNFRSLRNIVDSVGGVDLTIPYARKSKGRSNTYEFPAGKRHYSGREVELLLHDRMALELRDGQWVPERDGERAREANSQQVLQAVLATAKTSPRLAYDVAWETAPAVGMDPGATWADMLPLARVNKGTPQSLPVKRFSEYQDNMSDESRAYLAGLGYHGCHR